MSSVENLRILNQDLEEAEEVLKRKVQENFMYFRMQSHVKEVFQSESWIKMVHAQKDDIRMIMLYIKYLKEEINRELSHK